MNSSDCKCKAQYLSMYLRKANNDSHFGTMFIISCNTGVAYIGVNQGSACSLFLDDHDTSALRRRLQE